MLRIRHSAAAALVSIHLAGLASAQQAFAPGHVFVTSNGGKIFEFTPTGAFVRFIQTTATGMLGGIAFGPDGNLYATQVPSGKLLRVTPDYVVTPTNVQLDGFPDDLTSNGKDGLLVTSWESGKIVELSFANVGQPVVGSSVTTEFGKPGAVEVAADGTWYVTAYPVGDKKAGLKRCMPMNAKAFASADVPRPTSVLLGSQRSVVANMGYGLYTTSFGAPPVALALPDANSAYDLVRIANGAILTTCPDLDRLMTFDDAGDFLGLWTAPGMDFPYRIAVAPQVFDIKLKGMGVAELAYGEIAEKMTIVGARLLVAPDSGTMYLNVQMNSFMDPTPDETGTIIMGLRTETSRDAHGSMMVRGATCYSENGVASSISVEFSMKGIVSTDPAALAKSVAGTMHVTTDRPEGVSNVMMKFKGKRLVAD